MDLFHSLSSIVVPRWVKLAILGLLAALIAAYGASAVLGVLDERRSGWIEAGAYVLGVLIPILIIVLVAGFSEGGVDALNVRTQEFLTTILPRRMVGLEEPESQMRRRGFFGRKKLPVQIDHVAGSCVANYTVAFYPDAEPHMRELHFRLELNARKLNVNLMLPAAQIGEGEGFDAATLFRHTLEGAKHEGYWFNPDPIKRTVRGETFICLVGTKRLEDNFLVNPVAKLDLAQDLVLMLRSFVNVQPHLFAMKS